MFDVDEVKLIVCDVDGTLVLEEGLVDARLPEMFGELARRGIPATVATGRLLHNVLHVTGELGLSSYFICCEGGHVIDPASGDCLHHPHVEPGVLEVLRECIEDVGDHADVAVLSRDTIYVEREEALEPVRPWGANSRHIDDWCRTPEPLLTLVFGSNETVSALARRLRTELPDEISVILETRDGGRYSQIKMCSELVDKGAGAKVLADHLGIELEHVLFFGDWLNDIGLMRVAGHSVAPSDCLPEVGAVASRRSRYGIREGFVARELEEMFGLETAASGR